MQSSLSQATRSSSGMTLRQPIVTSDHMQLLQRDIYFISPVATKPPWPEPEIYGVMQQRVYESRINNMEELQIEVWTGA